MNIAERIEHLRARARRPGTIGKSIALLLVRLSLAAVFIPSGWGKINDLQKVTAFFMELGIPAPHANALLVSITELGCGVLLLVGLATRLAALPIVGTMLVAIVTAKRSDIGGLVDLFALEEFMYIVLAGVMITMGPGRLALDWFLARAWDARQSPRPDPLRATAV